MTRTVMFKAFYHSRCLLSKACPTVIPSQMPLKLEGGRLLHYREDVVACLPRFERHP